MAHRFPVKCTGIKTFDNSLGAHPKYDSYRWITFEGPEGAKGTASLTILTDQPFIVGRNYAIDIVKQAERDPSK